MPPAQGHQQPFESLPMPRKETVAPTVCRYRVYDNAEHFVTVTAGTALEALKASGVKDIHKIQRDLIDDANVLELDFWEKNAALEAQEAKDKEQNAANGSTPPPADTAAGGDPAAAATTPPAAEPPA